MSNDKKKKVWACVGNEDIEVEIDKDKIFKYGEEEEYEAVITTDGRLITWNDAMNTWVQIKRWANDEYASACEIGVIDRVKYGDGDMFIATCKSKEEAIKLADYEWNRLTKSEKAEREILACVYDTDTLEICEEFERFE